MTIFIRVFHLFVMELLYFSTQHKVNFHNLLLKLIFQVPCEKQNNSVHYCITINNTKI